MNTAMKIILGVLAVAVLCFGCHSKPFFEADETWFPGEKEQEKAAEATPAPEPDLRALVRNLSSKESAERLQAAHSIGAKGIEAREALPALLRVAKSIDETQEVRVACVESIGAVGAWKEDVIPTLTLLTADPKPAVRKASLKSLARLGSASAPAAADIAKTLRDVETRPEAADALAAIGPDALDVLEKAAKDNDAEVRKAAFDALARIGAPAVDILVKSLRDARNQEAVPGPLAHIGAPALPNLIAALSDKNDSARRGAAETLRRIGPPAKEALPALAKAANDVQPHVRATAQSAIAAVGPKDEAEVKAIVWGIRDSDLRVRKAAVTAARKIGPDASEASVKVLADALSDKRWFVRVEAADALGRVGAPAVPAVSALVKNLSSKDAKIKIACAAALGGIGKPAKDAAPDLEKLVQDLDPAVRAAAQRALSKIKE